MSKIQKFCEFVEKCANFGKANILALFASLVMKAQIEEQPPHFMNIVILNITSSSVLISFLWNRTLQNVSF